MSNNLFRASQTFIANDGAALTTVGQTVASISSTNIGVFGQSQLQVAAAPTITTEPTLQIFSGYTDGSVKKSNKISATAVKSYKGQRYQADTRDVWALGYNRKTATGSIEVANDTAYTFSIGMKFDKNLYSERNLDIRINFQSASTATQQNLAIQACQLINVHPGLKKDVTAIIVGDGNSAVAPASVTYLGVAYLIYGGTGATNYGVEITGKDLAQFQNTQYLVRRPYFVVNADRTTGFGLTTTVSQINAMDYGTGIYDAVYNNENYDYMQEGVLNRRLWPIPVLEYRASSTLITAAAIVPTVTVVILSDLATFSATVAALLTVGQTFVVGTSNEVVRIKYFVSATVAVLESPIATSEAGVTVKPKFGYSIINIDFQDSVSGPTGVTSVAQKQVRIAVPAIDTAGAFNSLSAIGTSLKTLFDAWMATTPSSFPAISI